MSPRSRACRMLCGQILLIVVVGAASAQDAWQPDGQVGDLQFNIPDGWKRVDTASGSQLVPIDPPPPQGRGALIGFTAAQTLSTDLRSWFNSTLAQLHEDAAVGQAGQIESTRHRNGFDVMRIREALTKPGVGYADFVFAAVRYRDRVQGYYFASTANMQSYSLSLDDFENSLRFASAPSPDHDDRAKPGVRGGMKGLYVGYKMRGLTGLRSHFEYLAFFPDGNVIRYLPEQGLKSFDFHAALRKLRNYCGRYRVNGSEVSVTWADNNTETATKSASTLRISGDSYFSVSSADGSKLDGTFRREDTDLAKYAIRFTPDGRFTENGMLDLVAFSGPSTAPGSGTYSLADNTLVMDYADGRHVALSFWVFQDDEAGQRPKAIHLNTYPLVRAQ
jgi:hypothetical protein